MLYQIENGNPAPAPTIYIDATGTRHNTNALDAVWSDADLQAVGLYRPQRQEPQLIPGQTVVGWELSFTGEAVIETAILAGPPTLEELRAEAEAARAAAYQTEADPLFFKVQRGEATEQEWLDKVAEIRARYPYPEE
jgi:hypothetical protein